MSQRGRRSGGVCVRVKTAVIQYITKVDISCDQTIFLKLDKELFAIEKDILLAACYVHPQGSLFYNTVQYDCLLDELEQGLTSCIEKLGEINILVVGDMNSRVSNLQPNPYLFELQSNDILVSDVDLFEPNRCTSDLIVNPFGRKLLRFCVCFELLILNGFCSPSLSKHFTYISSTGCSVNDYFISSPDLLCLFDKLQVISRIESSHMPLVLTVSSFDSSDGSGGDTDTDLSTGPIDKIIWQPSEVQTLSDNLSSTSFQEKLATATALIDQSIDEALGIFITSVKEAACCMTKSFKVSSPKYANSGITKGYPCYDKECLDAKIKARKSLKHSIKDKSIESREVYIQERNYYKKTIKDKRKELQAKCSK